MQTRFSIFVLAVPVSMHLKWMNVDACVLGWILVKIHSEQWLHQFIIQNNQWNDLNGYISWSNLISLFTTVIWTNISNPIQNVSINSTIQTVIKRIEMIWTSTMSMDNPKNITFHFSLEFELALISNVLLRWKTFYFRFPIAVMMSYLKQSLRRVYLQNVWKSM